MTQNPKQYIYHVSGTKPNGEWFHDSFSSKESLISFIHYGSSDIANIEKIEAENKETNEVEHTNYSINECGNYQRLKVAWWCNEIETEKEPEEEKYESGSTSSSNSSLSSSGTEVIGFLLAGSITVWIDQGFFESMFLLFVLTAFFSFCLKAFLELLK